MLLSERMVKNFCERASLDERVTFSALIGLRFSISFFPTELLNGVSVKEFLKAYDKSENYEAQKKQTACKVYVTTDKETIHYYGLMAQTSDHESHLRTLDFNKIGNVIRDWSKRLDTPQQNELLELVHDSDLLVKTIMNTMLATRRTDVLFEMHELDIKVLFFLYLNRHKFFQKTELQKQFYSYYPIGKVTSSIKRLISGEYIKKHINMTRDLKYTITGLGEKKVLEFVNYIIKANNF